MARFIVRQMVGFDAGAAARVLSIIGEYDTLAEAREACKAHPSTGDQAQYGYADIVDRENEYCVIRHANGIQSVVRILSACPGDDVRMTGTERECKVFCGHYVRPL